MAPTLTLHCGKCDHDQNLLRCSRCQVIRYCSKDHQTQHWTDHKTSCLLIKKARNALEREEAALHATPNDGFMNSGDPFITGVGHFWGLEETRDYMRARVRYCALVEEVKTVDGVQEALNNFMDMLRLCRSDNLGVRAEIPALMLRLGRDQECYDFIKWWAVVGEDSHYDWGDESLPYLNVKHADILEPVTILCGKSSELGHKVALTLIKIRLFIKLQKALANMKVLRKSQKLPPELFDQIRYALFQDIIGPKWNSLDGYQRSEVVETLANQIDQLYGAVNDANKYIWDGLVHHEHFTNNDPEAYEQGSLDEMLITLNANIASWKESPDAFDLIEDMYDAQLPLRILYPCKEND